MGVRVLDRWTGFCLTCPEDQPLVLTMTGPTGVRAWLDGLSWHDRDLRLTCTICGYTQPVTWDEADDTPDTDAWVVLDLPAAGAMAPAPISVELDHDPVPDPAADEELSKAIARLAEARAEARADLVFLAPAGQLPVSAAAVEAAVEVESAVEAAVEVESAVEAAVEVESAVEVGAAVEVESAVEPITEPITEPIAEAIAEVIETAEAAVAEGPILQTPDARPTAAALIAEARAAAAARRDAAPYAELPAAQTPAAQTPAQPTPAERIAMARAAAAEREAQKARQSDQADRSAATVPADAAIPQHPAAKEPGPLIRARYAALGLPLPGTPEEPAPTGPPTESGEGLSIAS